MKLKKINESIASDFLKNDEKETEASVIKPVDKEEKTLEPVNDEVHVAAIDDMEKNKEAARKVVADSSVTKNAEELVKEESKEKHESLDVKKVKDRFELAKLISEAKQNKLTWHVSKCLEEGFRYNFEITGKEEPLEEDLKEDSDSIDLIDVMDSDTTTEPVADDTVVTDVTDTHVDDTDNARTILNILKDKVEFTVDADGDKSKVTITVKTDDDKKKDKIKFDITKEEVDLFNNEFVPVEETTDTETDEEEKTFDERKEEINPMDVVSDEEKEAAGIKTDDEDLTEAKEDADIEKEADTETKIDTDTIENDVVADPTVDTDESDTEEVVEFEDEIPADDDFFGTDPDPVYDDVATDAGEDSEYIENTAASDDIAETTTLSKFDGFEPAEDVKEFWDIVTNSDKLSELEFFLDEFDIDNNEQLAEFLADEDHRDYLLSALGLGIDAEMGSDFEDDEPTPVDYDDIEEFSDKE